MQTIEKKSTKKAWAGAIAKPATEFPLTQLPILFGKIPDGLRGTLYRNGPARLERGGTPVGHWFDGDGAILAVHFTDEGATGTYRYVQTAEYQAETQADRFLYGVYGMHRPGPIWKRWFQPMKNAANTSVLALPDKLLALWEATNPYALDLQTLETIGLDNLGALPKELPYSAHYKRDPHTGEIFNFGVSIGSSVNLNLYKSDRTGKIIQKTAFKLDRYSIIHDFVLTQKYLVFFIPPMGMKILSVMLGLTTFSESLLWKPQLGTQVLIFDRENLSLVSRGETDPWFHWHFGNAYEDKDGSVILDVVQYSNFQQSNENLREVATGETHTAAKGRLWQVRLNPQTGKVTTTQEVVNRKCEFPVVQQSQVGQSWRYTYISLLSKNGDIEKDLYGAIARFDYKTETLTEADLGENRYVSEPIHAQDTQNPDAGWVLTVVYDGNSDSSEVWVFDSDRLDAEPVCKLGLPSVIPHSFHGTWKPA
ncbi:carotenoid oxygenase family protein [Nostocaceae cyanobacterium CENA369]|uniref:Carotenoid oxygenase family protein n=1 Tax=Dendronalium phyllosphericum CENA369 TaxID=1725256 RepID=A0A8J7INW5_9NOST|nr:carotenoid oxygenase family protein [Dendronalium phyllosphericum]MBH8577022.1 carotenoid oxygenase family protein [Dendronalium phyllosphericum CENA369]